MNGADPSFACDAMLRGLARWLRAWGYDASWSYGIADEALLAEAVREGRIVLTADRGILGRRTVKAGRPRAVEVVNSLPPLEQLRGLAAELGLPRRPGRCMRCGGALLRVDKASVAEEAPPRTFRWLEAFFRCRRCRGLFWRGTHWASVERKLSALESG